MAEEDLKSEIPLGKPTRYTGTYTPSLLYSMERSNSRADLNLEGELPFQGEDVWNAYELTWLDSRGKPQIAAVRIEVPCSSGCIVESKSLKLYLNSYAQTRFDSRGEILRTLNSDLGVAFRSPVMVELLDPSQIQASTPQVPGICLDGLDVEISHYERTPYLLKLEEGQERVLKETLHTNLFRSLCPVTGQPDFATVVVQYLGRPMVRTGLLAYLISYRCHQAFHEATIEQMFVDMKSHCRPEQLSISGYFLRRGGIDINPFRSNFEDRGSSLRLSRQ